MTEIQELREEIRRLREEIALLRTGERREYHYHYHGPQPAIALPPTQPWYVPGSPYYPVMGSAADVQPHFGFGTPTC